MLVNIYHKSAGDFTRFDTFAKDRLTDLSYQFSKKPISLELVFERSNTSLKAKCNVKTGKFRTKHVEARAETLEKAFDELCDKLKKVLSRRKDKVFT